MIHTASLVSKRVDNLKSTKRKKAYNRNGKNGPARILQNKGRKV